MRILGHLKVTTQREGLFLITKVVSSTSSILRTKLWEIYGVLLQKPITLRLNPERSKIPLKIQ